MPLKRCIVGFRQKIPKFRYMCRLACVINEIPVPTVLTTAQRIYSIEVKLWI